MSLTGLGGQIQRRLEEIQNEIANACKISGRQPSDVKILAISKKQPLEVIRAAYEAGVSNFGENYVQEALGKMSALADLSNLSWEMVGHIQSRKAKQVAEHFSSVHSLDSLRLAEMLSQNRPKNAEPLRTYLEVNLAGEESKSGLPAVTDRDWEALLPLVQSVAGLQGIKLVGLMTMPPLFEKAEESRQYFIKLRQLRDFLNANLPGLDLTDLSAGTSTDFAVAVEEGSTIIRVGSRLLGPRNYQN